MPFRINDLMITVLPNIGKVMDCDGGCSETCDGGVTQCPGGCSGEATFQSDHCPSNVIDPGELVELRELLRHTLSRVEAPGVVRKILPHTNEEIDALEAKLQGALYELRAYKATKEKR
ncbi:MULTISPECIES: hypothetical protein [unclassified Bacillus (in: firmicutes)]|uniref:hypothetical protein n=1 Tax=unclassified Bacillus (in: firmicutes) TaxID=185979 RepID=UPI000BF3461A|nr:MULTISPECIES: hypothetical protein [unclassified Bacillus (in: firmicutes)]PEU18122.1 hypothetical protein CN525_12960 [Bacillus sp. AFS014408]PFW62391.1 hypothetical protein COL20_13170 [Bacillus sp. AFS075034]